MGQNALTEFVAELTEFGAGLNEFCLLKRYSQNSLPAVSYKGVKLETAAEAAIARTRFSQRGLAFETLVNIELRKTKVCSSSITCRCLLCLPRSTLKHLDAKQLASESYRTALGTVGVGNGPNTVSESTVSNTELSEVFEPHRVPFSLLSAPKSVHTENYFLGN